MSFYFERQTMKYMKCTHIIYTYTHIHYNTETPATCDKRDELYNHQMLSWIYTDTDNNRHAATRTQTHSPYVSENR